MIGAHRNEQPFSFSTHGGSRQDGATALAPASSSLLTGHYMDLLDDQLGAEECQGEGSSPNSPSSPSQLCASPAKARLRLDDSLKETEVSHAVPEPTLHTPHLFSIASFPTSNQPVMDTLLKEMFSSLQNFLHTDFATLTHKFSSELNSLGERVNHRGLYERNHHHHNK